MLRSTLVAEGTSDRALLPILRWLLALHWGEVFAEPQFFGSSALSLPKRIGLAVREFPCELLLVHRDADRSNREHRAGEIREAIARSGVSSTPSVCVVPVRATEAWLLVDAAAIRRAAGHPNGKKALSLPRMEEIETVASPKERLHEALRKAAELTGRRLKKFHVATVVPRVAESMEDFATLRQVPAFRAFEEELVAILARLKEN